MAIAANFRKFPEAMALQFPLRLGKPVWNTKRPTTRRGRAFRAHIAAVVQAVGFRVAPAVAPVPQWWKDAKAKARALAKKIKTSCMGLDFSEKNKTEIPAVGEMYQGKKMTVAMHNRLLMIEIIQAEENSGDPELMAIAQWRRKGLKVINQYI